MKRIPRYTLAILAAVACALIGCTNEYIAPCWHQDSLKTATNESAAEELSWDHVETTVSNGVVLWTGQAAHGCVSASTFRARTDSTTIEMSVARFKDNAEARRYYDVRRRIADVPTYQEGTTDGFAYSVTKSVRPRSDPEGGGGFHDRRITYMDMWKNLTVVKVVVNSRGASRKVDMDRVASGVNRVVGRW